MNTKVSSIRFSSANKFKESDNKTNYVSSFSELNPGTQSFPSSGVIKSQALFRLNKTSINFKGVTPGLFAKEAMSELHPNWEKVIARAVSLYSKPGELRGPFERDYGRILYSGAFNRMMGKTQVFSRPSSDTTCTRMIHVNQVANIAEQLCDVLGLNSRLVRAAAIGHDVGHTPFGHAGERALNKITEKLGFGTNSFWHEKNSIRILDDIETLPNPMGKQENTNLTYGVRDAIISHCGELDENGLRPRGEYLDLRLVQKSDKITPFTWEGCVVRASDKMAYLGTDLDDAINNGFLNRQKRQELREIVEGITGEKIADVNNSTLTGKFVMDMLGNSSPEAGIRFSETGFKLITAVKKFNYANIYLPKDAHQGSFIETSITKIFDDLNSCYAGRDTLKVLSKKRDTRPTLAFEFSKWLTKYSDIAPEERANLGLGNRIIYSIDNQKDYQLAVVEFISSITDRAAVRFNEEIVFSG